MRIQAISLSAFLSVALFVGAAANAEKAPTNLQYPGAVALSRGVNGNWIYKSFPALLPLYVFDGDLPGKSRCDTACTAVWPLVRATAADKPVGNWTVVLRSDGQRQWAYKSRPVYTFYEDTPGNPKGVGKEEGWYYEKLADGASNVDNKVVAAGRPKKPIWRLLQP